MPVLTFNSNVAALGVQRRLNTSTSALTRSFERLSTGLRINRASDDAAGLAIAEGLRVNSRLFSTAVRNVNDAISMISIAGGTVDQQTATLVRLIELAEQSANGTLSDMQREALDGEYQALVKEIGRLGDSVTLNDIPLLLAGYANNPDRIGIQLGITGQEASQLDINTAYSGTRSGAYDVNDSLYGDLPGAGPTGLYTVIQLISAGITSFDEMMEAHNNTMLRTTVTDSDGVSRDIYVAAAAFDSLWGYVAFTAFERDANDPSRVQLVGFRSSWDQFDFESGEQVKGSVVDFMGVLGAGDFDVDFRGVRFFDSRSNGRATSSIEFTGVETVGGARTALSVLGRRLAELSSIRGDFGAAQSRLERAQGVLSASKDKTIAAESRILDVDVAREAARLAAAQIRQQAGVATLSLAGSQPGLLLSLLSAV